MKPSCDSCGIASFKTKQAYQRHLQSNKHKLRQVNTRKDLFQCKQCNKWYCGKSGLSHHKNQCNNSKISIQEESPSVDATSQQKIIEMELTFENERQEMKLVFEKERQEMKLLFDKSLKEQIQKIAVVNQANKSRDKRKKTTKEMRQHIADKQQKLCGECKLGLTLHFQIDHIIGLQFGGTDDESNLMALCCECHAVKSVAENRCRKRIQDAIKTILRETTLNN
jgi:5-methylcytosine-specific restriction endonuclease McrA